MKKIRHTTPEQTPRSRKTRVKDYVLHNRELWQKVNRH